MNYTIITLPRFAGAGQKIADYLNGELVLYSDHAFSDAFGVGGCIVALMSAGIAVRGCAPLLTDKWHDAAVVVVTPDMAYAIPVIGGHHGANECAKKLAGLGLTPVISTATEVMGKPSVEETAKETHRVIVNRDATRQVNGAILDGRSTILRADPPKIVLANPGVAVLVNESRYVIGIGCRLGTSEEEITSAIEEACASCGIDPKTVTLFGTTMKKFHEEGLHRAVAQSGGNLIFLDDATINAQMPHSASRAEMLGLCGVAEPCALALAAKGTLILKKTVFGRSNSMGKLWIVSSGPGSTGQLTPDAVKAIAQADVIIGNAFYLTMIEGLIRDKEVVYSSMGKEMDRAREAARLAANKNVAMISGGDAGVYGMASIVLEIVEHEFPGLDVAVLPGVTAACAAASRLGSPLSGDYVTLSLSDLLTPWNVIEKRLNLAFQMGTPVALYNPKSRGRPLNLHRALLIAASYRNNATPVGIVKNVFRTGEEQIITTLGELLENDDVIDMHSILIIGGEETRVWIEDEHVRGIITPRGYHRKYVY